MNKKNTVLIVIIAVLVIIAAILIGNNRYLSTLRGEAADFTVYDTASVTKLFFADKSGNKVLLQRTPEGWSVNNEFKANQSLVNDMLYTLNRMRIKMPVSIKKSDNIVTQMSSTNTKVEVFQMLPRINLFNKIKLFYHEKRSKVFISAASLRTTTELISSKKVATRCMSFIFTDSGASSAHVSPPTPPTGANISSSTKTWATSLL